MIKTVALSKILKNNNINEFISLKPISLYINLEKKEIRGWTDLYVEVVRFINQKYPTNLSTFAKQGSSFTSDEKLDIGNQQLYDKLKSPIEISNDIFLETQLTPEEIIQRLKYLCNYFYLASYNLSISFKEESSYIEPVLPIKPLKLDNELYESKESGETLEPKDIVSPEKLEEITEIKLRDLKKSSGLKPLSFSINDETKEVKNWSDLHLELGHYLWKKDPDFLRSKVPKRYKDNPFPGLGTHITYLEMNRPYQIAPNLYLDLTSNPLAIRNWANRLFDDSYEINIKVLNTGDDLIKEIPQNTITLKLLNSYSIEKKNRFFQKCTPVAFRLNNVSKLENFIGRSSSWKNFYFKVHSLIEGLYPLVYDRMTGISLIQDESVSIGYFKDYRDMREPVRTPLNHLVEIDLTEEQILESLTTLCNRCMVPYQDLLIECIPSNLEEAYFRNPPSDKNKITNFSPSKEICSPSIHDSRKEGPKELIVGSHFENGASNKVTESTVKSEENPQSFEHEEEKVSSEKEDSSTISTETTQVEPSVLDNSLKSDKNSNSNSEKIGVTNGENEEVKYEDSKKTKRISFRYLHLYLNWKPYLLQIGHEKIEVHSWQSLEIQTLRHFAKSKPKTLRWLASKEESSDKFYLATLESKEKLATPVRIVDDIYIELGNDPGECLEILNNLIPKLGFKIENISVYLKSPFSDPTMVKKDSEKSVIGDNEVKTTLSENIDELSIHSLSEVCLEEINLEVLSHLKRRYFYLVNIAWCKIPIAFQLRDQNYLVHSWGDLQLCLYKILLSFNPLFIDTLNSLSEHDMEILGISKTGFQGQENLIISDSECPNDLYLKIETDREKVIRSLKYLLTRIKIDISSLLIYYVDSKEESTKFYQKLEENQLMDDNIKSQLKAEVLELDIVEKDEYEHTYPISFELKGVAQTVRDWNDLYISSIKKLVEFSPPFLKQKCNSSFIGEKEWDLTNESGKNTLIKPVEIAPHVFLETDLQTSDIIRRLQAVIPECGIDFEDYSILVKPEESLDIEVKEKEKNNIESLNAEVHEPIQEKSIIQTLEKNIVSLQKETESDLNLSLTDEKDKEVSGETEINQPEFPTLLYSEVNQKEDSNDSDGLSEIERPTKNQSENNLVRPEDDLSGNTSEISRVEDKESSKPEIDSLITQYYLEESQIEEEQTSVNTLTLNQEMNQYILWMIQNGALNQDIHKSQFYLGILAQFLLDHNYTDQNLICIKDSEFLQKMKKRLLKDPDFQKLNFQNYNKPRQILNDLIDYRSFS